ncbi:alpha-L-rhamnosidase, partial [Actinomadura sp. HBU206391]|nr:alpha-L-rhamnosidase [Actinomadura sp. HBU206391]
LFVEGDRLAGKETTLPLGAARRMLTLTKAGLPLVFLGDWSAAGVPGIATEGENERLRAVLAELFAQPRVRNVAAEADVPAALAALGLRPAVEYAQSSTLLNARRVDKGVDHYYLCNGKHAETPKPPVAAIDHEVTFTRADRKAVPYRMDPWSGEVERVALYTEAGDRVTLRVALQPSEATVILFARPGRFGGPGNGVPHATHSEAGEVRYEDGRLVARAATAGTYATTLSDGRTAQATIGALPEARTLTSWRLRVEDWRPGRTPTETAVTRHDLTLDALTAWLEIPELADVSGIGRYSTTVELSTAHGYHLELGEVFDTCRVTVNGRRLPPVDLINPVVDVGPYLRRGTNTIEVEVATTLNNRLRVSDPGVYGGAARQRYGLIGPVRLVPYGEAVIRR